MLLQRIMATLERLATNKKINVSSLIYKKYPIKAKYGNAALEMDVVGVAQWFAITQKNYISNAAFLNVDGKVFVANWDDLTSFQHQTHTDYYQSYQLNQASEQQLDIYIACALTTIFFNGDSHLITPVEVRTRFVEKPHNIVCMNVTACQYASLKNPSRIALNKQLEVDRHLLPQANQIESEIAYEQDSPSH
ncbi:hypothetical protein VIBNISOn1_190052 [Vibrio nigripulchritudo SOn1]|uniref:Uncharacterized protein n=1 Tax=Vibrio nigripulchritudo SOn1 TaxID=1238450 RepID=A0AAV2VQ38_9VIBR|nr:hypothetical protein [Vibrio nigripulchritudo]CCO46833.1 hypothetical protein VIBNISOn1_190052 [Vibrio nigripulchritudo SOn1]